LSYHHLADQTLKKFGVNPKDLNKVCIYHFNQTNKPVENIKDEWYLQMELTSKNKRRLIPLLQFKKYYDKYHIAICHTLKKQISS
jgi:hypothetical protein